MWYVSIINGVHYPHFIFILQQESEISNMENRNYFSLHCVQMETQLIHANLESLHITMENLAAEESKAHAEVRTLIAFSYLLNDKINECSMDSMKLSFH